MDFISNSQPQIDEMLRDLGISSVDELFSAIPEAIRLPRPVCDDGMSELEGLRHMEALAKKNTYTSFESYLGGGAYEHYIPAIVPSITSMGAFLTSYTPYQAEASQGTLQATFEYQSAICALTGMEVANASMWDGATAAAEAVLMALRLHPDKKKVQIYETVHPHYQAVVRQYLEPHGIEIVRSAQEGLAAVLVQSPNVYGIIEEVASIKGFVIQIGNPLSYGLYAPPGEMGVAIAVGDTQPFGIPLNFGGPYAGYMATRAEYLRQLPGRLVGETHDTEGRVGYTLVLQAREQHIRREKALSNICTSQALMALSSLIAILWYGKEGIPKLALTNFQRASYLRSLLPNTLPGPIFNEFTVGFKKPLEEVLRGFRKAGIEPGWPTLPNHLTVAVTETKTKEGLDKWAEVAHDYL